MAISGAASASGATLPPVAAVAVLVPPSPGNATSEFDLKLPEGCTFIRVNDTRTVALCQAPSQSTFEKLSLNAPSIVTSLLAIGISFYSLRYNRSKDSKARQQSIKDDFWLRKIVSPASIEPFLKHWTELQASLPTHVGITQPEVAQYWVQEQKQLEQFHGSFRALVLIDVSLAKSVDLKLEDFDDCLAEYCGNLQQHLVDSTKPLPNRGTVLMSLNDSLIAVFKMIQDHQSQISR